MTAPRYRVRWYWLILPLLLAANILVHWPFEKQVRTEPSGPPGLTGGGPGPDFQTKIQEALDKLPAGDRVVIEERIQTDRKFFDSLGNLAPGERSKKIAAHFAANPPIRIPGLELPPPPAGNGAPGGRGGDPGDGPGGDPRGGPGGPGGGPENGHIPPPEVRHGLDQGIVNSLREGARP